jgi:cytochrome c oxidase subunit 1
MLLMFATPLFVGFANWIMPLQIGSPDVAFPRLNMLSYWLFLFGSLIVVAGFLTPGGAADFGWFAYAPLNSAIRSPGVGADMWIMGLAMSGFGTILGAVNFITTIVTMRAPGMTMFRMPIFVWNILMTSVLVLMAFPVLAAALLALEADRKLGAHIFDPANGGPLLWQHLFWFFGHPEVYILILPAMGMVSDIIANGSRKPIFGYHSMVFAIIGIAFLGWIVWGHHMFMSGMNPTLGSTFMVSTLLIAVPSAIKVFNWLGTMWRGNLHLHVPMLNAIGFVSMFTIGGLSGIFMAATPVDIPIHDTQFIVAHIHYVLFGGSLFALFAAIPFWYPKMFGRVMDERLGKVHFWLTFITYNLTFFPMHIIGMGGQMRRIYDPTIYTFLQPQQPINVFISYSAFALFAVQLLFMFNFLWSLKRGKKAPQNPWNDNGLEWSLPNPAPHGNWAPHTPNVFRGPYEFSAPEAGDADFLPQGKKLPADRDPVPASVTGGH